MGPPLSPAHPTHPAHHVPQPTQPPPQHPMHNMHMQQMHVPQRQPAMQQQPQPQQHYQAPPPPPPQQQQQTGYVTAPGAGAAHWNGAAQHAPPAAVAALHTPSIQSETQLVEEGWAMTSPAWKNEKAGHNFIRVIRPCLRWEEALHPILIRNVQERLGWPGPRPVQSIMLSRDIDPREHYIISTSTATGKTGAYLLPIVNHYLMNPGSVPNRVSTLILVEKLESVDNTRRVLDALLAGTGVRSVVIQRNDSTEDIRQQMAGRVTHILVSTPGKLATILNSADAFVDLKGVERFVMEEADVMTTAMGGDNSDKLRSHIDMILRGLPREGAYQMVAVSASFHKPTQKMIFSFANENAWLITDAGEMESKANVYQVVKRAGGFDDRIQSALAEIHTALHQNPTAKIIVFVKMRRNIEPVARRLGESLPRDVGVLETSGDLEPAQRLATLEKFKSVTHAAVLISTYGTNGRGTDVPDCVLVVLFDVPDAFTDYKHAIGRAGRREVTGRSVLLYNSVDSWTKWSGSRSNEAILREFIKTSRSSGCIEL
eukprot:TRINITY_DN6781_c2_g1_i3.p1 TRINITY_DN6781_c2_g1~~TRINITY_DN6781_c2_g1_i3.p1  ORF type:complete len:566 (+),score=133.26 TRINITY_DN6781_c2_g1_i3:71-1699(+)